MIKTTFTPAKAKAAATHLLQALSEREKEVLQLTANGENMKMIADLLFITQDTVDKHSRNIVSKLQARNMKHAVAIGIRTKLIQ
ncbi:MAG: helix-turn-helix transcriptional regulator [Bacteroidetes bacterium]|nr:helix-turn-helix transcriptional regulator [Bacteroidota bacterium]